MGSSSAFSLLLLHQTLPLQIIIYSDQYSTAYLRGKRASPSSLPFSCVCQVFQDEVFKAVKPIYEELSSDDLLSRCLGGYIQNNNESFNSVLWSIAPKGVHSSKAIVDIAANFAVCNFNDGLKSIGNYASF
ncbi:PREDICTED: uncharacterized protein LOC105151863 [Acromyrmex echinatior]|uniref:uncharacterized protein LOC105151863 n=1 Tax=Acromyrmex echinatior TaxID=103372 RepID=UPI000580B4DB|nr:PREDICTED: uncharacterized protein LOC105151863 [Acromyrmex echinatior]